MKFVLKIIVFLGSKNYIPIPDEKFLKLAYQLVFDKKLDLENPKTFNEKIQWLKLNNRKDIYTVMVDKYEAKKYVAEKIGEEYIIPTLGIYDSFEEIDFAKLPKQFVLKCTHDSGGVVICKDKDTFDYRSARKIINKHLKTDCYMLGREWPYKNVKRKIIVEKYMEDSKSKDDMLDYKFMCFNGKVKCLFICSERRSKLGLAVDFFDREWKHLPFRRKYRNSDKKIEKPQNFDLMIQLSEKLSCDTPFLRVDFYEINSKIYFGELTFFPGGGFEKFIPEKYDKVLGDWLDLTKNK